MPGNIEENIDLFSTFIRTITEGKSCSFKQNLFFVCVAPVQCDQVFWWWGEEEGQDIFLNQWNVYWNTFQ